MKNPHNHRGLGLKSNEPTADNCINCRFSYGAVVLNGFERINLK